MIDLHTHILPGIDDGAASVAESHQLIEALYQQNIRKAACTPHFDPTKISLADFVQMRTKAMDLLKEPKITLIPASETKLNEYLFHYPDISDLCIGNTKYLLLELPFEKKWNDKHLEYIERIINYYTVIPIIAHVERYEAITHKIINKLREMGCMIQVNTSSILIKKNNRKVINLFKDDLVDIISSDCHNMTERIPVFTEPLNVLSRNLGEDTCKKLDYNSHCIFDGIEIRKKDHYIFIE